MRANIKSKWYIFQLFLCKFNMKEKITPIVFPKCTYTYNPIFNQNLAHMMKYSAISYIFTESIKTSANNVSAFSYVWFECKRINNTCPNVKWSHIITPLPPPPLLPPLPVLMKQKTQQNTFLQITLSRLLNTSAATGLGYAVIGCFYGCLRTKHKTQQNRHFSSVLLNILDNSCIRSWVESQVIGWMFQLVL